MPCKPSGEGTQKLYLHQTAGHTQISRPISLTEGLSEACDEEAAEEGEVGRNAVHMALDKGIYLQCSSQTLPFSNVQCRTGEISIGSPRHMQARVKSSLDEVHRHKLLATSQFPIHPPQTFRNRHSFPRLSFASCSMGPLQLGQDQSDHVKYSASRDEQ
jgi:hypothetical protein